MPKTKTNKSDDSARQPMGWDLSDLFVRAAVMYLAYPDYDPEAKPERLAAAADLLVKEWGKKCGKPPKLVDILPAWWVAAREVCDVAEISASWGNPPTVLFRGLMKQAAVEFAEAMGMTAKKFAKEMDLMGLPRPRLSGVDT